MTTPGKAVLTSSGKRGLLSNGKVAIFNADGECPECCGEWGADCEACYQEEGTTPLRKEVVVSDFGYTGNCVQMLNPNDGTYRKIGTPPSVSANGTFVLTQTPEIDNCVWKLTVECTGTFDVWAGGCTGDVYYVETISSFTITYHMSNGSLIGYYTTQYGDRGIYTFQGVACQDVWDAADLLWHDDPTTHLFIDGGAATVGAP